ncbi:CMRF35-like molecule 1 [Tupaia chinensis]|uniref:CMRF35-like molecule 1 n=1 Tax=Tupaia chinensis TaxID=246437 RepID=UPI0003C8EA58|nr:CMRF35-like molecule 1 [Tupaia chinensis]
MSPEQVPQSLEGELCYANLTLQTKTPRGSSRKKASTKSSSAQDDQAEVEYVTMAPLPSEEVSYASLTLDVLDQEPTYGNTSYLVTCVPNVSSEEPTEYSTIRKS